MLTVGHQSSSTYTSINNSKHLNRNSTFLSVEPAKPSVSFQGHLSDIFAERFVPKHQQLQKIGLHLKAIGVQELELGTNLKLAKLLESAMLCVKEAGYSVPKRIHCDNKYFSENPATKAYVKKFHVSVNSISGQVEWDDIDEPIMYLNPKASWRKNDGVWTVSKDPRNDIWHETGHLLHMKNFKNNHAGYAKLNSIEFNQEETWNMSRYIGLYAANKGVNESIAEIYALLMSGQSLNKLPPVILDIYKKYNGPMPNLL